MPSSNTTKAILGAAVALFSLTLATSHAEENGQLSLAEVYRYTWQKPGVINALFDSNGGFVYLVEEELARVSTLDWKKRKEGGTVDFSRLPCTFKIHGEELREIGSWLPFPKLPFVLMRYCNSLYVLDKETLNVLHTFAYGHRQVGHPVISPREDYFAVRSIRPGTGNEQIHLYKVPDWELIAEWEPPATSSMAFTPDGSFLAVSVSTKLENKFVRECGLDFYELPSGKLYKRWSVDPDDSSCPRKIVFLPGESYLFVSSGLPLQTIYLWDGRGGKIVRRIDNDTAILAESISISPDGRLIAGALWNKPDTRGPRYEFKLWDLSGESMYANPLRHPPEYYEAIVRFSPNASHVVVTTPFDLVVYEIIQ